MAKRKIAVLGGGMGALSTVFEITEQQGWKEKYDITVYQLGWRLGGKAATGRNLDHEGRIEEHGYHTLFGFYENTFEVMRRCFHVWGRSPHLPMSELIAPDRDAEQANPERYALHREDAFVMLQQLKDGSWHSFTVDFPPNLDLPGDGKPLPGVIAYLQMALDLMVRLIGDILATRFDQIDGDVEGLPWYGKLKSVWKRVLDHGVKEVIEDHTLEVLSRSLTRHLRLISKLVRWLVERAEKADGVLGKMERMALDLIADLLRRFVERIWHRVKDNVETDWDAYRIWTTADFICTTLIGQIEDDVFKKGFDAVDDVNFWEWLRGHAPVKDGAQITLASFWTQCAYDSSFAYDKGDTTTPPSATKPLLGTPTMGAGTMLRGGQRLMLTYKGAMAWKFQTGAAEALCTPMYQVLSKRGVRFEFFSKVENLAVAESVEHGLVIEAIQIQDQVELRDPDAGYQPLVDVKDVPSWPSEPLWDQIQRPAARTHDLESFWTDWPGVGQRRLERGTDFDLVLLAIPVGGLASITGELREHSKSWGHMLDRVATVRTQAVQTWLTTDLPGLGWTAGDAPVNVGVQPLDTWADMTQTLKREEWSGYVPEGVSYFCSAMRDDPNEPPVPDPAYPPTQRAWVMAIAHHFFEKQSVQFWPKPHGKGAFDWSVLVSKRKGAERLEDQFLKANIDPSERYVLSVPKSHRCRQGPEAKDFANLYLAGDWTLNGLNVGCMEATVTSGLLAARAITGGTHEIHGENDRVHG